MYCSHEHCQQYKVLECRQNQAHAFLSSQHVDSVSTAAKHMRAAYRPNPNAITHVYSQHYCQNTIHVGGVLSHAGCVSILARDMITCVHITRTSESTMIRSQATRWTVLHRSLISLCPKLGGQHIVGIAQ